MSNKEQPKIAMLDTSFLIRLLKEDDSLHAVVPFNLDHAEKAGDYAHTLYQARDNGQYKPEQRLIIPNDTKLFAQASSIGALYFVTADAKASGAMDILAKEKGFSVIHVDIHNPISTFSGMLF